LVSSILEGKKSKVRFVAGAGAGLFALFVPLAELTLAAYARGLVGELSVTSMALLGIRFVGLAGGPKLASSERSAVLVCLFSSGVLLYPMALGLTRFDPYSLGFGSGSLLYAMGLLAVAAVFVGLQLLPVVLASSILAFSFKLLESSNLWDYWIDPWLFLFSAVRALRRITVFVSHSKSR
jgi:hypothetical protein